MNIKNNNFSEVSLIALAFSFFGASDVAAQTCITPPTCESLGYTLSQSQCSGHNFLKCPFNTSIGYCDLGSGNKVSCSDGGYSAITISGQNCTKVDYEGLTCYQCTVAKTCADGGYSQTQISGQTCKKVTYEGLTCYQCNAKSCSEMGYNLSRPKGQGWNCTACPTDPSKYSCSKIPCPNVSGVIVTRSCRDWGSSLEFIGYSGNECCYKYK